MELAVSLIYSIHQQVFKACIKTQGLGPKNIIINLPGIPIIGK